MLARKNDVPEKFNKYYISAYKSEPYLKLVDTEAKPVVLDLFESLFKINN